MSKIEKYAVIREAVAASTPAGDWYPAKFDSYVAAAKWIQECMEKALDPNQWMVFSEQPSPNPEECNPVICITGNGPSSRENARLFANARNWLTDLLGDIAALEADKAALASERDDLRAKLWAAEEAIRWADEAAEDWIADADSIRECWRDNPAVQRAKEAKP